MERHAPPGPAPDPVEDRFEKFVGLTVLALAGMDLYAAVNPDGWNWGYHHLAFFPDWVKFSIPIVILLSSLRGVRLTVARFLSGGIVRRYDASSARLKLLLILMGLGGAAWAFWTARPSTFFLGDGYLALRNLHAALDADNIALSFKREPLSGFLTVQLYHLLQYLKADASDQKAFQLLSVLSGVGSLVVLGKLAALLVSDTSNRLLFILLLLGAGTSQFFFGYVENYSLAFFGLLLFSYFGVAYLLNRVSIAGPIVSFALLLTMHFGMAVFAPALGLLIFHAVRRKEVKAVAAASAGALVLVVALLWMSDYSLETLTTVLGRSSLHLVPLTSTGDKLYAYTMFSVAHVGDLFNLHLLIHPFALVTILFFMLRRPRIRPFEPSPAAFFLILAAMGAVFTFVINCEIGMSRDWDLLAPFGFGVVLLAAVLWAGALETRRISREMLVGVMLVSWWQMVPWIAVNAGEERSIARFEVLGDEELWSRHAFTDAYEGLSIFYRERGDEGRSIAYLERYLAVDSTNPRIWLNLGSAYGLQGDNERAIRAYEKGSAIAPRSAEFQMQLGVLHAQMGDLEKALARMEKAAALDTTSAAIENNLGTMLLQANRDPALALKHFLRAIEIDPRMPEPHYGASYCYQVLGDVEASKRSAEEYRRLRR